MNLTQKGLLEIAEVYHLELRLSLRKISKGSFFSSSYQPFLYADFTPLHLATLLGDEEAISLLISNRADVTATSAGLTPFSIAMDNEELLNFITTKIKPFNEQYRDILPQIYDRFLKVSHEEEDEYFGTIELEFDSGKNKSFQNHKRSFFKK